MSWLARSITNSLKFVDDDTEEDDLNPDQESADKDPDSPESPKTDGSSLNSPSRGVKDDLSEFSKTLTSRFWGVASFLAPPPQSERKPEADVPESEKDPMMGIRGDFAEIGGRFRSGIYRLSNNINVSEITKMASNLLQLESDDESEDWGKKISLDSSGNEPLGVTQEVVDFARDVSMHPETWLDFPLSEDDADFDMSDPQQEHALVVERLAPRLSTLRLQLCPAYMSESHFWKVYFVLLQPRLDKQDAQLLSTPQIVEARSLLAQELKNRKATERGNSPGRKFSDSNENSSSSHDKPLYMPSPVISENLHDKTTDLSDTTASNATSEIGKDPEEMTEVQIEDKQVIAENAPVVNTLTENDEDETDDWLEEGTPDISDPPGKTIAIEDNDDVSFSDLEEDDDDDEGASTGIGKPNYGSDRDTRDWVRL